MKYFIDTEFIEDGKTIDLISIGIVCEDGREYYAVNEDCDFGKASLWVETNVIPHLPKRIKGNPMYLSLLEREENRLWKKKETIRDDIAEFCGCKKEIIQQHELSKIAAFVSRKKYIEKAIYYLDRNIPRPEFWGYYSAYDWVVFCQLFGTMMELPKGFPMYCKDIKQECDRLKNPRLPEQGKGEHNALKDARWNKLAWEFLKEYEKGINHD